MAAYFVTSTGTDIGKTFVTAGLIRYLREAGQAVHALKPVVSGYDPSVVETSDPAVLLSALGRQVSADEVEAIAPWRFRAPLSPDLAAAREGRNIDFEQLIAFSRKAVDAETGMLFIEGVGGIMVPLDAERTVLDWMAALQIPLLLVVGGYLGTISHTLTALDVLAHATFESRRHRRERERAQSGRTRRHRRQHRALRARRRRGRPAAAAGRHQPASGLRQNRRAALAARRQRSAQPFQVHEGFEHAFGIDQRVQQDGQDDRAARPAHPAEQQAEDEYLPDHVPVVLHMDQRPQQRDDDDDRPGVARRAQPATEQKAAEQDFLADRRQRPRRRATARAASRPRLPWCKCRAGTA